MKLRLYWSRGSGKYREEIHWSRGRDVYRKEERNFGDWMSPFICEALSGKEVVFAKPKECDLMAMGSILKKLRKISRLRSILSGKSIDIWGAGSIGDPGAYPGYHRYHAVRGPLTRKKIANLKKEPEYGDPGLLCELLLPDKKSRPEKKYSVGLIPHYIDRNHPLIDKLLKRNKRFTLIDVFDPIPEILERVGQCEYILSSRLHGLIVSDALHVPNSWIKLSEDVTGEDFKFRDYYAVFGTADPEPYGLTEKDTEETILSLIDRYERPGLEEIKEKLTRAFPCR